MLPKYKIEYGIKVRDHIAANHYETEDPVACEQFLAESLRHGFKIRDIKHEGVSVPKKDFTQMVKNAASMLAAEQICRSLDIKPEEEHFRFGFTA